VDLTEAMYAATADPPPTSIDVDRLITGEHRRSLRLRAATGTALIAVLIAGVVMAPQLLARPPVGLNPPGATPAVTATCFDPGLAEPTAGPTAEPTNTATGVPPTTDAETPGPVLPSWLPPCPGSIPSERPFRATDGCQGGVDHGTSTLSPASPSTHERLTEPCEAAVARLVNVIRQLSSQAGLPLSDAGNAVWILRLGIPVHRGYEAGIRLQAGYGRATLALEVTDATSAADRVAFADKHCTAGCQWTTRGDGLLLVKSANEVWSVRPDGTVVKLYLDRASVSQQQLTDVVTAPELTLFP
jgi:hypothetical protein